MKFIVLLIFTATSVFSQRAVNRYNSRQDCLTLLAQRNQEVSNKAFVLEFYQRVFGDQDFDAIYEYVGEPYIQHNPLLGNGRDALRAMVPIWLKDEPKRILDIRRAAAEGDLVWVHQRAQMFGTINAVVDIFRVENGRIVEHWDVIQPVPATSANNNTMF